MKGILSYCIFVEERYNPLLKKNEICSTESCTSSTRREDSWSGNSSRVPAESVWCLSYFILLKLWIISDWFGNTIRQYFFTDVLLYLKTSALNFQFSILLVSYLHHNLQFFRSLLMTFIESLTCFAVGIFISFVFVACMLFSPLFSIVIT